MRQPNRWYKILAVWLTLSQLLWTHSAVAGHELSRRTLRSESMEEGSGLQPLKKNLSAGLEEKREPTEEELLERELALIQGVMSWQDKIRMNGSVKTDALDEIFRNQDGEIDHLKVRQIFPLIQRYQLKTSGLQDSKGDIYVVDDETLGTIGHPGLWRGPAGTLFLGRGLTAAMMSLPIENTLRAFETDDFEELIDIR